MKSLEPIVQQHLQTFVTCLTDAASKNSGQVNMNEWFTHLLFAVFTLSFSSDATKVIGDLAMGTDFDALHQTGRKEHFFIESMHSYLPFTRVVFTTKDIAKL